MKSIYISGYDAAFIGVLSTTIKNNYNKHFEVIGEEEFNDDVVQNASFSQPDFFVCDSISVEVAKEIFENCPNTSIVICGDDSNRTNATSNDLNKAGYYNVIALSKETTSPKALCDMLLSHKNEDFAMEQNEVVEEKHEKTLPKEDDVADLNSVFEEFKNVKGNIEEKEAEFKTTTSVLDEVVEKKEEKVITNVTYNNLNLSNIRSKTIAVYSVKGGTGKTTIARELANVFNLVKLPKKLVSGSNKLRTLLVDLDFERGNLRTMLGVENTPNNIYNFISNILDKMESGIPLEKIRYNSIEIMENYTFLLDNNYRVLLTDQNDIPSRIINRINVLDRDGDLFIKIIKFIVKTLRSIFDVVIFDLPSDYNDFTSLVLEMVDDIVYPLCPTLCDIDGFKIFNDEIAKTKAIRPEKIHPVLNKASKHVKFMNEFDDVFRLVQYETINENNNQRVKVSYNCFLKIPESIDIINFQNDIRKFHFASLQGSQSLKQPFLLIASDILPVFKSVNSNQQLENYRKNLKRKEMQKLKALKTKQLQEEKARKKKEKQKGSSEPTEQKLEKVEAASDTTATNGTEASVSKPHKMTRRERKLMLKRKKQEIKAKRKQAKIDAKKKRKGTQK